jgi:hypothetical protein
VIVVRLKCCLVGARKVLHYLIQEGSIRTLQHSPIECEGRRDRLGKDSTFKCLGN